MSRVCQSRWTVLEEVTRGVNNILEESVERLLWTKHNSGVKEIRKSAGYRQEMHQV